MPTLLATLKKKEFGLLVLLLVICLLVALKDPSFIKPVNIHNLAKSIGMFGLFSIGCGLVIITGGIDLSVGSLFALLGVILVTLLTEWQWHWALGVLVTLGMSAALGACHGFLVTRARLQPFIVTLCGLLLYRGLARFIAGDSMKGFGRGGFGLLRFLADGNVWGIPMPSLVLAVVAGIMWVLLHRSVYGRYLFAVGRNEEAARFSGIRTKHVVASAYVLCSLLAGMSGILFAFYTNSVSPAMHGNFYELYGIAAAVLGGCSLQGGEGSILGILIGVALLQVLQNLVNILGIPSSLNFAVMGAVILIGVLGDQLLRRRTEQANA